MTSTPLALCVGFDDAARELIARFASERVRLVFIAAGDGVAKATELAARAGLVLVSWEGPRGPTAPFIKTLAPSLRAPGATPITAYGIVRGEEGKEMPTPRQALLLGLAGWIKLPQRAFEIQRLLYDLAPDDGGGALEADPLDAELAALGKARLKLPPPAAQDTEEAAINVLLEWRRRTAEPPVLGVRHRDEAFAQEIAMLLQEAGTPAAVPLRSADATIEALRRRALSGLVVYVDDTVAAATLELIVEARQVPAVPTLLLFPTMDEARRLAPRLSGWFFDAVAVYDRRREAMRTTLTSWREAAARPDSPRAMLEGLRASLRPESPGAIPLDQARQIAARLAERPGKRYWATTELLVHTLRARRLDDAQPLLAQLIADRPAAFNTLCMRHVVAAASDGREVAATALAQAALAFEGISAERLFHVGSILDQWGQPAALKTLLDAWQDRESLRRDHRLQHLAGSYYRAMGKARLAGSFRAKAALLEPARPDYVDALARHLAATGRDDRAIALFEAVHARSALPFESRLILARCLASRRRLRDARALVGELLGLAPGHRQVEALAARLEMTVERTG